MSDQSQRPALVILESPYAGAVEMNISYARAALRNSLLRGEAPIASHLLYTQLGVLDDDKPEEREMGIARGLAWRKVASYSVFYIDRGWSAGMRSALQQILGASDFRLVPKDIPAPVPFRLRSLYNTDEMLRQGEMNSKELLPPEYHSAVLKQGWGLSGIIG